MLLSRGHKMGVWCLTGCVAVVTVFFHTFILLLSVRHVRSSQPCVPCETIVGALSLQSVLQQGLALLWMSLDVMDPQCLLGRALPLLEVLLYSLHFSVLWNTAFLLFYYATRLVMEPVHCYTHAQRLILHHVRTVVFLIPLCSFGFSCPLLVNASSGSFNATWVTDCSSVLTPHVTGHIYLLVYTGACNILPGIVMVKSSISIAVHLTLHLRHMKSSTNGFHGPKLGSEMRVIRMSLALALLYLGFLALEIYTLYLFSQLQQNVLVLAELFSSLYKAMCGLVLVYGKKSFWKELLHVYNLTLDRFPCLAWLKAPEKKPVASSTPSH